MTDSRIMQALYRYMAEIMHIFLLHTLVNKKPDHEN